MDGIRVAVRVRPPIGEEVTAAAADASSLAVSTDSSRGTVQVSTHKSSFDVVLGAESSQDDAYGVVADAIGDVAAGVNVCVVAYGQTGSGKTYTMLGRGYDEDSADMHEGAVEPEDEWGIIPRAVNHLFALLSALEAEAEETRAASASSAAASSPARSPAGKRAAEAAAEAADESRTVATVACSYLQLYNEQVLDLLQNGRDARPLSIHERKRGRTKEVFVRGLSEVRVTDASDVMRLLRVGARNRVVRATEFNEASSRSHAVLQLAVEVEMPSRRGSTVIRRAKLTMVDLAGSEKWTETTKTGTRRVREMTSINKSLSALGNVVAALTTAGRTHIPYRDSKLTRLLQDSIGGNCRTAIIATISPTTASAEESTSTLLFADRARRVMAKVKANEILDDAQRLAQALKEVARLKAKLKAVRSKKLDAMRTETDRLSHENERFRSMLLSLPQGRSLMRRAVLEGWVAAASPPTPPITQTTAASSTSSRSGSQSQQQRSRLAAGKPPLPIGRPRGSNSIHGTTSSSSSAVVESSSSSSVVAAAGQGGVARRGVSMKKGRATRSGQLPPLRRADGPQHGDPGRTTRRHGPGSAGAVVRSGHANQSDGLGQGASGQMPRAGEESVFGTFLDSSETTLFGKRVTTAMLRGKGTRSTGALPQTGESGGRHKYSQTTSGAATAYGVSASSAASRGPQQRQQQRMSGAAAGNILLGPHSDTTPRLRLSRAGQKPSSTDLSSESKRSTGASKGRKAKNRKQRRRNAPEPSSTVAVSAGSEAISPRSMAGFAPPSPIGSARRHGSTVSPGSGRAAVRSPSPLISPQRLQQGGESIDAARHGISALNLQPLSSPSPGVLKRMVAEADAAAAEAEADAAEFLDSSPLPLARHTIVDDNDVNHDVLAFVDEQDSMYDGAMGGASEHQGGLATQSVLVGSEDDYDDDDYDDEEDEFALEEASGAQTNAETLQAEEDEDERETPVFRYDGRDVGCRVRLRSARMGAEEEGTVTAYDSGRALHMVLYDSGERKWHSLRERRFDVVTYTREQHRPDRVRPEPQPVDILPGMTSAGPPATGFSHRSGSTAHSGETASEPVTIGVTRGKASVTSLLADRFGSSYGAGPSVRSRKGVSSRRGINRDGGGGGGRSKRLINDSERTPSGLPSQGHGLLTDTGEGGYHWDAQATHGDIAQDMYGGDLHSGMPSQGLDTESALGVLGL